ISARSAEKGRVSSSRNNRPSLVPLIVTPGFASLLMCRHPVSSYSFVKGHHFPSGCHAPDLPANLQMPAKRKGIRTIPVGLHGFPPSPRPFHLWNPARLTRSGRETFLSPSG